MTDFARFAVFYVAPEGSDLAAFGATWLGWDIAQGQARAHPDLPVDVAALTETPRKYGFHGTLKPPFRLQQGMDQAALAAALGAQCRRIAAFQCAPLVLRRLGRFVALVPAMPCVPLSELARRMVVGLDTFRAPAPEAELVRRRRAGLTSAQEALLQRWGYPYVLDEFRFHLTLTGKVDAPDETFACLTALTARFCETPFAVHEVALCGEMPCGRFKVIERCRLGG